MKAEPTPLPWRVVGPCFHIHTVGDPYGHGEMFIAEPRGWGHLTGKSGGCAFSDDKAIAIQQANAEFIVHCVNHHQQLVEALEAMVGLYDGTDDILISAGVKAKVQQARAALTQGKEL